MLSFLYENCSEMNSHFRQGNGRADGESGKTVADGDCVVRVL